MYIIVCVDDRNGLLFNKRRLSSDSAVCRHIAQQAAGKRLWMDPYSAPLFDGADILADPDFLAKAQPGDICFVERGDITPYATAIEGVTLYRWNRAYPSDTKFPLHLFEGRWTLAHSEEFPGHSHEKITQEQYVL